MNIASILAVKGHEVSTVLPDTKVAQATQRMRKEKIGALVVSEDGASVQGIITDRTVLWAITDRGVEVMDDQVRNVMTPTVITCTDKDHVSVIMAIMTERRIRHIPVLDSHERLCGIVSIGDVVKHRLDEIQLESEAMRDYISNAR
jgi:CBS domain-containing protein